jgi:hypothetical protein
MNEPQTLAQRLAQARIPAPEAQHYAMILADALRKIHEAGEVHGGVSPASILLTGSGLELGPARRTKGGITPYTAPELLAGQAPDSRSDVFAFGAVVYEMFSGRRAFEGDGEAALSAAIETSTPASCGSPSMDRLIRNCLAKDPGIRWQRMHKVLMEIRLLAVSARHAEAAAVRREPAADAGLRAEIQHLEGRVAARLQACEKTMAETQLATTELRGQLAGVDVRLAAACERQISILEGLLEAGEVRIGERFERDREANAERMARLEEGLEGAHKHIATLDDNVAEDFMGFEHGLTSQATAIESARTAMAQTDALVERVVEALESLQSVVLEPREERSMAIN